MKVSQNVLDLLNAEVGLEFATMIDYFALATRFCQDSLPELHGHFCKLAERKKENAVRFLEYIASKGSTPRVQAIPAMELDFATTESAVNFALDQEVESIDLLSKLAHTAKETSDQATWNFVQEPLKLQNEEILLMRELLACVESAGEGDLLKVEDFLIRKTSVAVEV